jgi:hypothetical protein
VHEHIDGTADGRFPPADYKNKGNIMRQSEPPSARAPSPSRLFRIGRNSRGNWVAQDQHGLCGGLFVDRTEAVKFAMFENGHQPQAVVMVPGILELDISGHRPATHSSTAQGTFRRAA